MGFSITAAMEIVYWIIIKPFGLPKRPNCTKHHYPSPTHKWMASILRGSAIAALLTFTGFRFYLVLDCLFFNPPTPEETRNQIPRVSQGIPDY